jgi:hypothetical protein
MRTTHLKITPEQDSTSLLFRKLFLLSLQLENYREEHLQFQGEIGETVRSIDRLMEVILQLESSGKT